MHHIQMSRSLQSLQHDGFYYSLYCTVKLLSITTSLSLLKSIKAIFIQSLPTYSSIMKAECTTIPAL